MGLNRKELIEIIVLLSGTLIAVLNQTLLSPALPVIMHQMSVTETTVQWLTSAYSMVEAVIIPLNAFLLGRFTTRKLYVGAFGLFVLGSLVCAIAPSFALLLLGRVLQAIATGVCMPMVFTIVLLMVPKENRGATMGIIGLVISFAPAIGPVASGILIDMVGWRMLFGIVAVLGAVVIGLAIAFLENAGPFERTSFDVPSLLLSMVGMGTLLYGLSTCTSSDVVIIPIASMLIGAVLLALFVRRQDKLEVPMLRVGTLLVRRYRVALIVCCLLEGALIAIDVLIPLYLQNTLGATPTVTGIVMMPAAFSGAITGVIAGKIFDKKGVRAVTLVGAAVIEASAIGLCLCGADASVFLVATLYTVEAVGWQLISTPSNTWGINSLNNEVIQHGNAMLSTLMQVGASFGTAVIVSLTALGPLVAPTAGVAGQTYMGYHLAFIGTAVLLGAVALVIIFAVRNKPGDEENMKVAALRKKNHTA